MDKSLPRASVCIVAELPPPPGGMAVQAMLLTEGLRREGHAVFNAPTNPISQGSPLRRLKWVRSFVNFAYYLPRLWGGCRKAECVHILSNSYLGFFLFTFPAVALGRLLRKRVIIHYHGGSAEAFLQRWFWLARFALRSADLLVVPSPFLTLVFRKFGITTIEVPNILNLSSFPFRRRAPLRPYVIMSRHLEPEYNVACGLRAFASLRKEFPAATLVIAGDGSEKSALLQLTAELGVGDGVRFVGNVANEQMRALYDQADIYLNTSRVDNQPVSILEAFACGMPVVSTRVGGIPHMVTHGTDALLGSDDDFAGIADNMRSLLLDRELAERLVQNGRERVRKHSWDSIYPKLGALYTVDVNS